MFTGPEITAALVELQFTHVVWLPDSALGPWEPSLEAEPRLRLVRVCREGEAWVLAAGLHLGGARPLVMIQNTGFFESGDAMRNVLFDLKLPLYALLGYRSYLVPDSPDTARRFTEPVLDAWGIDRVLLDAPDSLGTLRAHALGCRSAGRPGVALVAEGRM